jgi:hypothetical protein
LKIIFEYYYYYLPFDFKYLTRMTENKCKTTFINNQS